MSTQQQALDAIFAAVQQKHGKGSITTMGSGSLGTVRGQVRSGLEALDRFILGAGGWPWERISEVYGPESSGKSSLVMRALASVQAMGGVAFHVDAENALSDDRAQVFGVDRGKLLLANDLESAEQAGSMLLDALNAVPKGVPFLAAFDSIPAMVTKLEAEAALEQHQMAPMARFMAKFVPKLVKALKGKDAHVIFVNQTRQKTGVVFGNPEYTPGGNTLKFLASTRLRLSRVKQRDGGIEVKFKSIKSRFAEPQRELISFLHFQSGWDDAWTTLNHAKEMKVVDNRSRDLEAARVALGWPAAEAAERLGASPDGAGKISKRRGKVKGREA